MNLELALGVLKEGLRLINTLESSRHLNRIIKLEREYYEELGKDEDSRSQLFLDERMLELSIIAKYVINHDEKK